jgi:hypothetical protein
MVNPYTPGCSRLQAFATRGNRSGRRQYWLQDRAARPQPKDSEYVLQRFRADHVLPDTRIESPSLQSARRPSLPVAAADPIDERGPAELDREDEIAAVRVRERFLIGVPGSLGSFFTVDSARREARAWTAADAGKG